jgi:hypothetical protein
MIRALVERLPVMMTPRWLNAPTRPIFIGDLLAYLLAAADITLSRSRTFAVGGPDVVSYGELMSEYARQRGLRRRMIPLSSRAPYLSALLLGVVAPRFARLGRQLIESTGDQAAANEAALREFAVSPMGVREAIARALRSEDEGLARTRWSRAVTTGESVRHWGGERFGNRLVDSRTAAVAADSAAVFTAIERIGGRNGWYSAPWMWRLRGWLDLLVGGVGMRRGRRDPDHLAVGDALDCWRVVALERGRRLLLAAEMKMPGRGWLEFQVRPHGTERAASLRQTAVFDPLGFAGLLYWYTLWPVHQWVFARMLRGLAVKAESLDPDGRHTGRDRGSSPP